MVNVKNRKCNNDECQTIATFNYPGMSPLTCVKHKEPGMWDVTAIRCSIDDCITTANFGYPGNRPTRCSQHKETDMIGYPRKRCINDDCTSPAIYGSTYQVHCETHKTDDEYNLVERDCKSCGLLMMLNNKDLCGYCDPTMIKSFHLVKQKLVKKLLDKNKLKYKYYDKIVDTACGRERPDFVFDCGTHYVILEVDENQHGSASYRKYDIDINEKTGLSCEEVRMFNIAQGMGMPTIFIRYNPDSYKVNGREIKMSDSRRHKLLIDTLTTYVKLNLKQPNYCSAIYLFYDEFDHKMLNLRHIEYGV